MGKGLQKNIKGFFRHLWQAAKWTPPFVAIYVLWESIGDISTILVFSSLLVISILKSNHNSLISYSLQFISWLLLIKSAMLNRLKAIKRKTLDNIYTISIILMESQKEIKVYLYKKQASLIKVGKSLFKKYWKWLKKDGYYNLVILLSLTGVTGALLGGIGGIGLVGVIAYILFEFGRMKLSGNKANRQFPNIKYSHFKLFLKNKSTAI